MPLAPPPPPPGASAPRPPVPYLASVASLSLAAALCGESTAHAAAPVERVLDGIPVSSAQRYVAQTPVVARDGAVYLATMEPGPGGDHPSAGDLRTVVRKGVPDGTGGWRWTATSIDDRTVADAWHTAPSIGVDERGFVHVAYNMHNLPWQYAVSRAPGDIDDFEFRGQRVSQAELDRYRLENRTSFPDLGTAAIPGNQITYPAFVNDRAGRLHVSYRFAARPGRAWSERTLSTGLARYETATRTWRALGGKLALAPGDHDGSVVPPAEPRSLASASGWTSYLPRPTFGPDGSMSVSLAWRSGNPGSTVSRPCALRTAGDGAGFTALDGVPASVPALPDDCPRVASAAPDDTYHSIGDAAADAAGHHHVLLSATGGGRTIHGWTGEAWAAEPAPGGAVEIFFDRADNLWAIGTGPAVHVRRAGGDAWERVVPADGRRGCFPHASLDTDGRTAFVFTLGCDEPVASVTRLDLPALLGEVDGRAAERDADRAREGGEAVDGTSGGADAARADAALAGTSFRAPPLTLAHSPGPPPDGGAGEALVLPRLEWRRLSLPVSSVGLTPALVFAALPRDAYGERWTLVAHDPEADAYRVPGIDEPLAGGSRHWAIQDVRAEAVVELARRGGR